MRPTRRTVLRSVATSGLVLGLAGCTEGDGGATATETEMGDGSPTETEMGTETGTGTGTATGTSGGTSASVQARSHPDLGDILVGPEGLTLYMFEKDTQGAGASTCAGDCAGAWPPLVAESPTKGEGVTASLSTFKRENGDTQVAANGWPLYYFRPDKQPGDANGQGVDGFGGLWWVLGPDGTPKKSTGTATGTGTKTGGTSTETDSY